MSKLMTYELRNRFKKFPLDSQDGKGINAEIVAMFFNLEGPGTWILQYFRMGMGIHNVI